MEQSGDKTMIAEMDEFLTDDAQTCPAAAADPEDGLPFESIDSYSTNPIGFEAMSLKMLTKVEAVFDLAVLYNRHSSKYLKKCAQLEKGIKYLGTLCYTKHALERKKQTFPSLGQLSTEKLYCMASFHFEKLDRALSEYIEQKHEIDDALLDMQTACITDRKITTRSSTGSLFPKNPGQKAVMIRNTKHRPSDILRRFPFPQR